MDVHVRVDIDEDGPVVVKSGTGPAGDRLRHEHERLLRAVHPGVVALAGQPSGPAPSDPAADDIPSAGAADPAGAGADDEPDGYVLRTRYAGEPVSRWRGTIGDVAGLGAAVAATLADLHALGVVHGRLDADHILIGDDGRPRLCGLSHPGGAAPSDDVTALGTVLGDLLARAPAGRRHRPRGSAGAARALRQVIERATDPLPTRRPTAAALADAVLAAVPGAGLPTPAGRGDRAQPTLLDDGGSAGSGRAGSGRTAAKPPDTLDRIWSFVGEESDDERWAAAFGPGPRDLPAGRAEEPPWRGGDGIDEFGESAPGAPDDAHPEPYPTLPTARVDTPAWDTTADGRFPPDREPNLTGERAAVRHDHGARLDDEPPEGLDDGDRWGREPTDDLLTRDHHVPVPRVARPGGDGSDDARASAGRTRRLVVTGVVAAACVAVAGAVTVGMAVAPDASPGPDADETPGTGAAAPAEGCAPAAEPSADVDGDGCPEGLVVNGSTVDAGVARWSLGEPGDLVTVGDWDCDGQASAALLRPTSGDVFVFTAWAPSDEPVTVGASQQVDGGVGIRAEPAGDGCDRLVVVRADGTTATVEVPR
jgi:hypothetical protein